MSETPVPRDPGQDDNLPGVPAGPGDRPSLGSPDWRLVPQSPDWPEWMDEDGHARQVIVLPGIAGNRCFAHVLRSVRKNDLSMQYDIEKYTLKIDETPVNPRQSPPRHPGR